MSIASATRARSPPGKRIGAALHLVARKSKAAQVSLHHADDPTLDEDR